MSRRKKLILSVLTGCAVWVGISALFQLPPAGIFYDGNSLQSCYGVLKRVDGMKREFAEDKGLKDGDPVNPSELHNAFDGFVPKCPGGGTYTYNPIGVPPACSFAGTSGPPPEKELIGYFFWRWKIPPSGRHEL